MSHGYNQNALASVLHLRCVLLCATLAAISIAGCAAALGPGYTIDKQEIQVEFDAAPQPVIHLHAEYSLRNTGNRPLTYLELRLPGRRRFHFADPSVQWDTDTLTLGPSPNSSRNVAITFPSSWNVSASHSLRMSVEFQPPPPGEGNLAFSGDAFFLPAEGWNAQLLPSHGIFATGGVPPNKWLLTVRVPRGFLVHMSGGKGKSSRSRQQETLRMEQRVSDGYPFVIAGRYASVDFKAGPETVHLWSRENRNPSDLRAAADALTRTVKTYNTMFGERGNDSHQIWIVECPVVSGCFSSVASNYSKLISEDAAKPSAEMVSFDSVMADLTSGPPEIAAAVAPSLASSWLGYGQNPGFYEQEPPLSALPAFAASRGREAVEGPQVRAETIRRTLRLVPPGTSAQPEPADVVRAKSLLFFFALQDRYGQDICNKALSHMLYARRGGGFDLDDFIAAFEQESHQNVAEFVRHWMKRPGVPSDFRARYENATAADVLDPATTSIESKENIP
jgi:hypothetical protein